MSQIKIVQNYKTEIILGQSIDFVPLNEEHLQRVVELRNQDRSRYFLNQSENLSFEKQKEWYEKYKERTDDLYWCIRNKENIVVGTIRLYNITDKSCNHGSFIIDEKYSFGTPYALEAQILSLEFAFQKLKVKRIINDNREDNIKVNSISQRMGFHFEKEIEIRGIKYMHYILEEKDSRTSEYKVILDQFMKRRT